MARNVKLNKRVFDKKVYQKTIDTSFKELGIKTLQEQLNNQKSPQDFFNMYNQLFYEVNEKGPDNSHEFLVKTSGDYIGFKDQDELIEALRKTISDLRKELLENQQELAEIREDLEESNIIDPFSETDDSSQSTSPIDDIVDSGNAGSSNIDIPNPFPDANQTAMNYYGNIPSNDPKYKFMPVSAEMMRKNMDTIMQSTNGFQTGNNSSNNKSKTRDSLQKVIDSGIFNITGNNSIGENYKFQTWSTLRNKILNESDGNKAKDNLYEVVSSTVDQMSAWYNSNRNFKEQGGIL